MCIFDKINQMGCEFMLEKILNDIDNHKEELIDGLIELIRLPSSDEEETIAQRFVERKLEELGFDVQTFKGIDERCLNADDYCEPDIIYHKNAYNVAGVYKNESDLPSLMLFAHIDSEHKDYFGKFDNPYEAYEENNKIYGLGSSDDKGGIAMMLFALEYVQKHVGKLPYDITVLSVLGKHGGAYGTLSALMKGYRGDYSLYLHPAETGNGFGEIKNISLGVVDLDISVKGKQPKLHDDLDPGMNANIILSQIALWLDAYNKDMRKKHVFDFGSFNGTPSYVLNVGTIDGAAGYGGVCQNANMKVRIRFFKPLTIDDVVSGVKDYLKECCLKHDCIRFEDIDIVKGNFNASPAIVDNDDQFVKFVEKQVTDVSGITEFIHQYHGGSDIRLPILYGNSKCVGIGPCCHLPYFNEGKREYIDVDDYITGIKILASILYRYPGFI